MNLRRLMGWRLFAGWFAVALVSAVVPVSAQEAKTGFLDRVYKTSTDEEAKYVLFVPHSYDGKTPLPVILFLHGAGETGSDGKKQATVGIGPAIRKREKTFPFLVILPQASHKEVPVVKRWQAGSPDANNALAILDEVSKTYPVDRKRIYLTGLSMGGFGTWSLAAAYPDKWAAIVPICGGGDVKSADKIKHLPCWCYHGDNDKAVPVKLSRDMIEALKAAGGKPEYTELPGVGHNSWDAAYGNDKLYDWLLKHSK